MKHVGDITKLSGYTLPAVDIITGGSPCQDLSVAGKRAGLAGERSGLFMEQIRIIKEMRDNDIRNGADPEDARPRYMVWENVPGAFSSNGGKDFQAVLTEIARVAEPDAPDVPLPEKGKWSKAGCLYGAMGEWSIAWRVHDAQFWGVPQRRKRISLVADFGGLSAPEILFEREGLSGDPEPCGETGQETAGAVGSSVTVASGFGETGVGYWQPGIQTLRAEGENRPSRPSNVVVAVHASNGISSYDSNAMKSSNPHSGIYEADTARTLDLNGGSPACNQGGIAVVQSVGCDVYNQEVTGDVAASLTAASGGTNTSGPKVLAAGFSFGQSAKARSIGFEEEVSPTLRGGEGGNQKPCVMAFAQNQVGEVRVSHMYGTLNTNSNASGRNSPLVYENPSQDSRYKPLGDVSETVSAKYGTGGNNQPLVVSGTYQAVTGALTPGAHPDSYNGQDAYNDMLIAAANGFGGYSVGVGTLRAAGGDHGGGSEMLAVNASIVRRLTPLECERLQGYPDRWTDIGEWVDSKGKKHKDADSPRYKALGNSIALPFWQWMFGRIVRQYPQERRDKLTLGSLFDGIGGFPLTAQRNGIEPVWASEIEEFPIAVTKARFPDESV